MKDIYCLNNQRWKGYNINENGNINCDLFVSFVVWKMNHLCNVYNECFYMFNMQKFVYVSHLPKQTFKKQEEKKSINQSI